MHPVTQQCRCTSFWSDGRRNRGPFASADCGYPLLMVPLVRGFLGFPDFVRLILLCFLLSILSIVSCRSFPCRETVLSGWIPGQAARLTCSYILLGPPSLSCCPFPCRGTVLSGWVSGQERSCLGSNPPVTGCPTFQFHEARVISRRRLRRSCQASISNLSLTGAFTIYSHLLHNPVLLAASPTLRPLVYDCPEGFDPLWLDAEAQSSARRAEQRPSLEADWGEDR